MWSSSVLCSYVADLDGLRLFGIKIHIVVGSCLKETRPSRFNDLISDKRTMSSFPLSRRDIPKMKVPSWFTPAIAMDWLVSVVMLLINQRYLETVKPFQLDLKPFLNDPTVWFCLIESTSWRMPWYFAILASCNMNMWRKNMFQAIQILGWLLCCLLV